MLLPKEKPGNIPSVKIAYAVKVIPEQDLTVTNQYHIISEKKYKGTERSVDTGEELFNISEQKYKGTQLSVVDDTGEELFNKSIDSSRNDYAGLAILDNQTYRLFSENMSHMFMPQATIVHFTFYSRYGSSMSGRLMFNDQDIILDEQHNIILARYENMKAIG